MEQFEQFWQRALEEHLCEFILNLDQQFRWQCHLKIFLFLALSAIAHTKLCTDFILCTFHAVIPL